MDEENAGSSSPTPPTKRSKVDESSSPPAPAASQTSNKAKLKMKAQELRNNRTGHTPGFSGVPGRKALKRGKASALFKTLKDNQSSEACIQEILSGADNGEFDM